MIADIQPAGDWIAAMPTSWAPLYALMIAMLLLCFFGYVFFRLWLVGIALLIGPHLGALVVGRFREAPTGPDFFIAATIVTALLGMAAWFLFRLFSAAVAFAAVGSLVLLYLFGAQQTEEFLRRVVLEGSPDWRKVAIGAAVGFVAAAATFVYLKAMLSALFALLGAAVAVSCGAEIVLERSAFLLYPPLGEGLGVGRWAILYAAALACAAGGVWTQRRLAGRLRTVFAPAEPGQKPRRRKRPAR
jgi:hypothetical protein